MQLVCGADVDLDDESELDDYLLSTSGIHWKTKHEFEWDDIQRWIDAIYDELSRALFFVTYIEPGMGRKQINRIKNLSKEFMVLCAAANNKTVKDFKAFYVRVLDECENLI